MIGYPIIFEVELKSDPRSAEVVSSDASGTDGFGCIWSGMTTWNGNGAYGFEQFYCNSPIWTSACPILQFVDSNIEMIIWLIK